MRDRQWPVHSRGHLRGLPATRWLHGGLAATDGSPGTAAPSSAPVAWPEDPRGSNRPTKRERPARKAGRSRPAPPRREQKPSRRPLPQQQPKQFDRGGTSVYGHTGLRRRMHEPPPSTETRESHVITPRNNEMRPREREGTLSLPARGRMPHGRRGRRTSISPGETKTSRLCSRIGIPPHAT